MNKRNNRIIYFLGIILLLLPFAVTTPFPVEALTSNPDIAPRALPSPGQTVRVSVATDGSQGNNHSQTASISADGRFVVFASYASNLVPGTIGHRQIYLRDLQTNTTKIVSVNNNDEPGNLDSNLPTISSNGNFVAFSSGATNLVSGTPDNFTHIYVRDLQSNTTTRVSVASNSDVANHPSQNPSISADGRYVTFHSSANNLDSRATHLGVFQVYVHDRQTGQTNLVSLTHDNKQPNQQSRFPSISANGRYVAYDTFASNMLPGQTGFRRHIYIFDRVTNQTTQVSVNSAGEAGNNESSYASVSEDGRFVAFQSYATNLVPGDTNGFIDVFVRDMQNAQTFRASVASDGTQGDEDSGLPSISADGRFVAFQSLATNLVSDDTNHRADVFVHDLNSAQTTRVSVSSNATEGNDQSVGGKISGNGSFISFTSEANNLVPGDTNNAADVFVHSYPIKPTAAFIGNPTTGTAPLTVSFTNQSQGDFMTCFWNFGDSNSSSNCNPTHTYQNAGTYSVSLTVGGLGGTDTEVKTGYITVTTPGGPITAAFVGTPTIGTTPLTVNFTNQSQGDITSCTWNFGNGISKSCNTNITRTYDHPGIYTVSLTVSGPGGTDVKTIPNYINVSDVDSSDYKIFLPLIQR